MSVERQPSSTRAPRHDVYGLVSEVRRRVVAETGVVLEPEIRFIGDFAARSDGEAEWPETAVPRDETVDDIVEGGER